MKRIIPICLLLTACGGSGSMPSPVNLIPAAQAATTYSANSLYASTSPELATCPANLTFGEVFSVTVPGVVPGARLLVVSTFNVTNDTGYNAMLGHRILVNGTGNSMLGGDVTPEEHERKVDDADVFTGLSGDVTITEQIQCNVNNAAKGPFSIFPAAGYLKVVVL